MMEDMGFANRNQKVESSDGSEMELSAAISESCIHDNNPRIAVRQQKQLAAAEKQ